MSKRNATGMSIIELLITLAITLTLYSACVPIFDTWKKQNQLSATAQDLYNLVQFARYSALTLQARISMCPLKSSGYCARDWNQDLSVFMDLNGNRRLDPDETLLRTIETPKTVNITWQGMGSGTSLHFNRQGVTFVSNGTFLITNADQELSVVISRIGKPRVTHTTQPPIPRL